MSFLMLIYLKNFSQDFKYSFTSNLKAYQEIDVKGDVIDSALWEKTNTKVTITQDKCIVEENGIVNKFQVLSSELKTDKLTRVEIKAVKNNVKYNIELTLINKGEFFFLIKNDNKIELYKTSKLKKN